MFLPDADGAFRNSRDSIKFPSVDDQITVLLCKRTKKSRWRQNLYLKKRTKLEVFTLYKPVHIFQVRLLISQNSQENSDARSRLSIVYKNICRISLIHFFIIILTF